jgi:hypothetical protein
MRYLYGLPDQETYSAEDLASAYEEIIADCSDLENVNGLIIVEVSGTKKSGARYCSIGEEGEIFEPECGRYCEWYQPRNGKNGICKSLRWSLLPTGATWEITGEWEYTKLTERWKLWTKNK